MEGNRLRMTFKQARPCAAILDVYLARNESICLAGVIEAENCAHRTVTHETRVQPGMKMPGLVQNPNP